MTKKLGFQLAIPFGFEVLTTQPDLVTWGVALWLDTFIMGSLLKFLGVVEILLAHGHQLSSLKDSSSAILDFERGSRSSS